MHFQKLRKYLALELQLRLRIVLTIEHVPKAKHRKFESCMVCSFHFMPRGNALLYLDSFRGKVLNIQAILLGSITKLINLFCGLVCGSNFLEIFWKKDRKNFNVVSCIKIETYYVENDQSSLLVHYLHSPQPRYHNQ